MSNHEYSRRGRGCNGTSQNTYSALDTPDEHQNLIIQKRSYSETIVMYKVYCPQIARYCAPGQFVVVRCDETGERLPLTIADYSRDYGWIILMVQVIGAGTRKLFTLGEGEKILDIAGPLGHKSEIDHFGTVVCIGGGLGVAPVFPIQRALKHAGNRIISIMGARNRALIFWEDRMRNCADELIITTDDGSYGRKGFVTTVLSELIEKGEKIDRVIAIGPTVMMRAVVEVTRIPGIKTIVSLNSIMVDGTGMCGGCRVEVAGETKFTCVDGPEFDGHDVDFDLLLKRLRTYDRQEAQAIVHFDRATDLAGYGGEKGEGRISMPEQDPVRRRTNFNEVSLGYTPEMARSEALRCLQCKKPFCVDGCPVNIDIPGFIAHISEGRFKEAAHKLKEQNFLPAVCGRVCPQETQCEAKCVLGKKGEPIAIGRLERFAADFEATTGKVEIPVLPTPSGKKIAVVGAGPAGLTAAADLAMRGHRVVIFEALHAPGGVLIYGIPEFRLPKAIVQREADFLTKLGVEFRFNIPVGQSVTVTELLDAGFDAVFIGTGAGLPWFLGIPGENLNGVYSSNEFLTRVNLMKAYRFPEYETPIIPGRNVAVVGGGNVAMDSARSALRLGAQNVYIVYRRTRAEMPARDEEIHHAVEEGIIFKELTAPIKVMGDDNGRVCSLECIRMKPGEPDESGRRRSFPIEGSEHVLKIDQFIVAIGQGPNPILTRSWPDLELNRKGNIMADANMMTNIPGVFAGGDIVTGAATVIEAMGAGKKAAASIDAYLRN